MVVGFHGTQKLEAIVRSGCLFAPMLVSRGYDPHCIKIFEGMYSKLVKKLAELSREPEYQEKMQARGVNYKGQNAELTDEERADIVEYCGYTGVDHQKLFGDFKEEKRRYYVWFSKNREVPIRYAGDTGHVLEFELPDVIVRPSIVPSDVILVHWRVDLEYVKKIHTPSDNFKFMKSIQKGLLKSLEKKGIEVVPY